MFKGERVAAVPLGYSLLLIDANVKQNGENSQRPALLDLFWQGLKNHLW